MNKIRSSVISLLACATLLLFCAQLAQGQIKRVYVAGLGDDTSSCSRSAPCRTFAGAIAKVDPGGEIDVLDSGGFGNLIITKALTIDATGVVAGILAQNVNGININAGPNDVVVLRNLSIDGVGVGLNGIKFSGGKALYLEDCRIENFHDYGVDFEPSTGGTLFIENSIIINNGTAMPSVLGGLRGSGGGLLVKSASGTAFATVDNTRVAGNFIGINASDNSKITVSNSVISRNYSVGLLTSTDSSAPAEMNVEHSVVTLNLVGIQSGGCSNDRTRGPSTVRISGVNVTGNSATGLLSGCGQVRGVPGSIISARNNTVMGNNPDGAPTSTLPQQ